MPTIKNKVQEAIDAVYCELATVTNTHRRFCLSAGNTIREALEKIPGTEGVMIVVVQKPNLTPGYAVRVTHGDETWDMDLRPSNQ